MMRAYQACMAQKAQDDREVCDYIGKHVINMLGLRSGDLVGALAEATDPADSASVREEARAFAATLRGETRRIRAKGGSVLPKVADYLDDLDRIIEESPPGSCGGDEGDPPGDPPVPPEPPVVIEIEWRVPPEGSSEHEPRPPDMLVRSRIRSRRCERWAERRELVEAWRRSGSSLSAFALENGIAAWRLRRWARKLGPVTQPPAPSLDEGVLVLRLRGGPELATELQDIERVDPEGIRRLAEGLASTLGAHPTPGPP